MGPLGSFKNPLQAKPQCLPVVWKPWQPIFPSARTRQEQRTGCFGRHTLFWPGKDIEGKLGAASAERMCPHTSPAGTLLCWPSAHSLRLLRVWSSLFIPVGPILSDILPVESQAYRTDTQTVVCTCHLLPPPPLLVTLSGLPHGLSITVSDVETTAVQGFP